MIRASMTPQEINNIWKRLNAPRKPVKLVCTSDTHGMHREAKDFPEGDIFIHAGDFSDSYDSHYIGEFNDWLGSLPYKHKIVIAGNHDGECIQDVEEARAEFTNAIFLHNSSVEVMGLKFYGSPTHPQIARFPFGLPRNSSAMFHEWEKIPLDTDVLITHGPPHGIGDRTDHGTNVGCELLLKRVLELRPRLHVFGHIHEGYGMYTKLVYQQDDEYPAEITFLNPSFTDSHYNPDHPFVVVEL